VTLTRLVINAVALVVAALAVPGITLAWGTDWLQTLATLTALALVLGVINVYLRPIVRLLSLPLNLVSLGLFSFVINAALLLLTAWLVDLVWAPVLKLGDFPPDLTIDAIVAAVLGSGVVSVVSTLMSVLLPDA
jgi:putative membrane protein